MFCKENVFEGLALMALLGGTSIHSSEFLTGEWSGARQQAHQAGIDFFAAYANDLMGNPIGGQSQGFTNAGSLDTVLTFDLDTIAKIPGCSLYNSICWRSGSNLSAKYIGNEFPVQQLYGGETYKLAELYLQESLFNRCLNLKLGRVCAGNDFIASPLYLRYVSGAINSNPISVFLNTFFSIYPFATWGAYFDFRIHPCLFKFGIYNCNQNIWKNKYHGFNFSFESPQGLMWISEWTYLHNQESNSRGLLGNYTIGGYYISGNAVSNYGYYLQFDQKIYRGLTSWGAFLFAPADRNEFPFFCAAGLIYQGMWASRPGDALCLGMTYGHYSDDMRKTELLAKRNAILGPFASHTQSAEANIELNYWFQATSWLTLTPVAQYIINPKGFGTIQNALVVGIQVSIDL